MINSRKMKHIVSEMLSIEASQNMYSTHVHNYNGMLKKW